jgi:hypothetical protein
MNNHIVAIHNPYGLGDIHVVVMLPISNTGRRNITVLKFNIRAFVGCHGVNATGRMLSWILEINLCVTEPILPGNVPLGHITATTICLVLVSKMWSVYISMGMYEDMTVFTFRRT